MEIRQKLSTPPEEEEITQMVLYARNIIEEFRRAKHYKNILHWPVLFFLYSFVCDIGQYFEYIAKGSGIYLVSTLEAILTFAIHCVTKHALVFY